MRASSEGRSLTHFVTTVQDVEIRDALQHYTIAGPLGALLDSEQDGLTDSPFVVFEIEELMGMGEKNLIPVLLYLFRRFERSLKGQPALLILDEAWVMLGHPVFRGKIREWLKVLRKANCAVVLATQSLSDAAASGILDVLMEACPTKILLPNEEADKSGTSSVLGPRDLYALFGLNETEIEIIKNARKKRQYYYISPLGRRLFELRLGAYALAFVAASDKVSVARIRELTDRYGADWVHHWLEEKGVPHEALTESKAA
jgi:type IV secretion system protein VirB4